MSRKQWVIFSILIWAACSPQPPAPDVDINTMKVIIWDLMKADEYVLNVRHRDSSENIKPVLAQYQATVYQLHNIAEADFKKAYKQYAENPVLMKELYDSVQAVSQRRSRAQIIPTSPKIN
ncbi:MAG: DUF4296 domain-containing protein [Bacteroidetes bacterium]|jgi:phosphoribosylanthranilate isomerase|nr:MAG: DUF4296 domain-containing protein [Bacteroidota bacterium]TAE63274.1 MAG: DUF4296 domain-containing protein [Bacteroidota bacterium]TAF95372.1 MAG: DUF4296 domain-containing protein [Bacteroidota bacterium]